MLVTVTVSWTAVLAVLLRWPWAAATLTWFVAGDGDRQALLITLMLIAAAFLSLRAVLHLFAEGIRRPAR